MSFLKLKTDEHMLTVVEKPLLTTGNENIDRIEVEFDSTWEGMSKVGVFKNEKNKTSYALFVGGGADIPADVLFDCEELKIGIVGVGAASQITSRLITYDIEKGAILEDIPEPDEDIYIQILNAYAITENEMNIINKKIENATEVNDMEISTKCTYSSSKIEQMIALMNYKKAIQKEIHNSGSSGYYALYQISNMVFLIFDNYMSTNSSLTFNYSDDIDVPSYGITQKIENGTVTIMKGSRTISVAQSGVTLNGTVIFIVDSASEEGGDTIADIIDNLAKLKDNDEEINEELKNTVKTYKKYNSSDFGYSDGYMCTDGSTRTNKAGFKYTRHIRTGKAIKISGHLGGFKGTTHTMALVCFFDKALNLISVVPSESTSIQYFETEIPENAYYFYISSNDNLGVGYYNLYYDYQTEIENNAKDVEVLKENALQNSMLHNLSVSNFLKNSGTIPIATWIDDDTVSQLTGNTTNGIEKIKSICDEFGIKCTFGCIANVLENTSVKNLLLNYQNEGFHITSHSMTHNATKWYGNDGNATDIKACEIELVQSLTNMQKEGFLNSDEFIIPGGNQTDEEFFEMIARHTKNAVLANQGGTSDTGGNYYFGNGKYKIYRLFIDNNKTLDSYKSAIDRAFRNGKWLVIGTHSGKDSTFDEQLLRDVIAYIKEKGIEFYTLHRGFEIRKPCYDAQLLFS